MNYEEWQTTVPVAVKADSVWKMEAYRIALFLSDIAWRDVTKLMGDRRTIELSDQLYRAAGAISSNIAEGYSRSSTKDRLRFYEYALGSARESRDWCYKARFVLGEKIVQHPLKLYASLIRLMLTTIPQQRDTLVHEDPGDYGEALDKLLAEVPESDV